MAAADNPEASSSSGVSPAEKLRVANRNLAKAVGLAKTQLQDVLNGRHMGQVWTIGISL